MYEHIFERIPLSALRYDWFIEHISNTKRPVYDGAKRVLDIVGSLIAGAVFLVLLPFVWLAMHFEGKGTLFVPQERMGMYGNMIRIYKIRTMTQNDSGVWIGETENRVTKVGALLRKTSIDELPQFWNILKGEMSLIGPRNDIIGLARRADHDIPYYRVRYMIKPGITGWAQTHQQYAPGEINPQSIEAFKVRLAYDLYYVKHRSIILDINIALRTIKTLLSRFGVRLQIR
jgi:lipopolysaccharide/colanic/teichoic acid biosynthesis glycosyltransferase